MTDTASSYASSPDMPHRIYTPAENFYYNAPKSIINTAGDGFRLSLELQLVGQQPSLREELASADIEIQMIIKKISEFSLMLKQVGKIMDESRTIASQTAIDTVTDIKRQSEKDFDEIKNMIEIVQKRDENGHLSGIEVAEQVTMSFKKRKMQYYLGQLEYLKDSLAIMLQTLELGKEIASAHEGKTKAPSWKTMTQERAEIQNMIVVQHWSFTELQKLYKLAEKEAMLEIEGSRQDSPPPSYDAANPPSTNTTLTIMVGSPPKPTPAKPVQDANTENTDSQNALVPYTGERSLEVMKNSIEEASAREERALSAQVNDIVDHLLDEWTEVGNENRYRHRRQIQSHAKANQQAKGPRKAHVESDESDTTESDTEFERSEDIGGFYLEGPKNAAKKNVRFNPRVEDEIDEEDLRPKRTTKKHTLRRVGEASSDTDSSTDEFSHSPVVDRRPANRRSSVSSSGSYHRPTAPPTNRSRGTYGGHSSISSVDSQSGHPPAPRGIPYQPQQSLPRPMPIHGQSWAGPTPATNQLRPPPPPGAVRQPSTGPHGLSSSYNSNPTPSPGASPVMSQGSFFPREHSYRGPPPPSTMSGSFGQQQQQQQQFAPSERQRERPRQRERQSTRRRPPADQGERRKEDSASRNIKKGIFGGTAIAGILELLQGLDGL